MFKCLFVSGCMNILQRNLRAVNFKGRFELKGIAELGKHLCDLICFNPKCT